jgi:hypothetical protein
VTNPAAPGRMNFEITSLLWLQVRVLPMIIKLGARAGPD